MLGRMGHEVVHRFFLDSHSHFALENERESMNAILHSDEQRNVIESVDAVVVNGEGTIHDGAGLHLLAILGAAQSLGKATFLVNAVFENTPGFEAVLNALDDFTVRDARSSAYLKSRNIRHRLVLDSILAAGFEGAPIRNLENRIVVSDWHPSRTEDVGVACSYVFDRYPKKAVYYPFERVDAKDIWKQTIATIATSSVLVTGRHHGAYIGILAEVPFVLLPSNTSKIQGLVEALGISVPIVDNAVDVVRELKSARDDKARFAGIKSRILDDGPLTTFNALGGKFDPDGERRELKQLDEDMSKMGNSTFSDNSWNLRMTSRSFMSAQSALHGHFNEKLKAAELKHQILKAEIRSLHENSLKGKMKRIMKSVGLNP
jgi:hypothetical protein